MELVTAITEKGVELNQVVVQAVEEANHLTAVQKEVMWDVFNEVKETVQHIVIDMDVPNQIKIMQIISRIIKTVQDVSAAKSMLTGIDKKVIALECGRKCIKMMMKDHLDMLMLYDTIAEPALETMLDLSRKMKIKDVEVPTGCMGLFSACMKSK